MALFASITPPKAIGMNKSFAAFIGQYFDGITAKRIKTKAVARLNRATNICSFLADVIGFLFLPKLPRTCMAITAATIATVIATRNILETSVSIMFF